MAVLSEAEPLPGLDLAEVLGVSDIPAGVVNLLSGRRDELAIALGAHRDLNAIIDAAATPNVGAELDRLARRDDQTRSHWQCGDEDPLATRSSGEGLPS